MKFRYLPKGKRNDIPKKPGVYALGANTEILYIGKAANLRERVKSHFHKASYRDNLFVHRITRVGWFETQSDIDALLLESQLIKSHQPKYNVMWKDDKKYFYVSVAPSTMLGASKERLPRVFLTHQPFPPKPGLGRRPKPGLGTRYMGPFVEGKAIKHVLKLLRKTFPYYTAKKHPVLPCPYCHIDLCPGPKPDVKEYKQNIGHLISVLHGRRISVVKNLKASMKQASKEQDFEKAARLRDQVFSLENIISHTFLAQPSYLYLGPVKEKRLPKPWSGYQRIEAYDISNIQGKLATGSMVTFLKGRPAKEWYRKFNIHITGKPNDFAMMEELISRRLKHPEWPYPDLMLIDGGKGQLSSALKALGGTQGIRVVALAKRNNELFSPKSKNPVFLKDLPQQVSNLLLHIRDEAHRFAIFYHKKLRKVDAIGTS